MSRMRRTAVERVRARRSEMQEHLYKIAEQELRVATRSEHNMCADALRTDERLERRRISTMTGRHLGDDCSCLNQLSC